MRMWRKTTFLSIGSLGFFFNTSTGTLCTQAQVHYVHKHRYTIFNVKYVNFVLGGNRG
jgi:hypothetical protein